MKNRYVNPAADPRLNLKRRFRLAKAIPAEDEVAEKISKIYDQGMEFCYFDGSEGVGGLGKASVELTNR